jgi:hypothetical protein
MILKMSAVRTQSEQIKHNGINSASSLLQQLKVILTGFGDCHEN